MSYSNSRIASNNELIGGGDIEKETAATLTDLFFKAAIFVFVFILLFFNLVAVSLSLQCNEGRDLTFKIASAMFAFMFGFIYIVMNYFLYKINVKKWPCILNAHDPFFFKGPSGDEDKEKEKEQSASEQAPESSGEPSNNSKDDEF